MISGFLLIDKPENITTFDLIRDIRKKSGLRKIGHTGTLDPFATGLAILCLGKTTRLSSLLLGQDKEYLCKMELGTRTDTGDVTGEKTEVKAVPKLNERLLSDAAEEIKQITGQMPPRFSAIKVSGKPAYRLARNGEEFTLKERKIKIHSFEILSAAGNMITYRTKVSKGTYIRSLTETFAGLLGSVAYTKELRRLSIGNLSVEQAVKPDSITGDNLHDYLKSVSEIFSDYPRIILQEDQRVSFLHGREVGTGRDDLSGGYLVFADRNNSDSETMDCLGWGTVSDRILKPKIVLGNC